MRNIYIKTTWIDNKTPINAEKLNKIENAISDLYQNSLSPGEFVEGNGIRLRITEDKKFEISTIDVISSSSCAGIEVIQEVDLDMEYLQENIMYYVLSSEGKLIKQIFNNKVIYEVE